MNIYNVNGLILRVIPKITWAAIVVILLSTIACNNEFILVKIEKEDAFINDDVLRPALTLVLKPENSSATEDETYIELKENALLGAEPSISLVPFPLSNERFQRWLILRNGDQEVARGWLDATPGQNASVRLSILCPPEEQGCPSDGIFCNGISKCGGQGLCVTEDACGFPSCVDATCVEGENGEGTCTGVPNHARCAEGVETAAEPYCNIVSGCALGKVGCTYNDDPRVDDNCGPCSYCQKDGTCSSPNDAEHLDPRTGCRTLSCTANDAGVVIENSIHSNDGTLCKLEAEDESQANLGICVSALCVEAGICGNGLKEVGEACEINAESEGSVFCREGCVLPRCGDGIVDQGKLEGIVFNEECDDGLRDGGNATSQRCLPDCTWNVCGDGYQITTDDGFNEECDDGNRNQNDICFDEYCNAAGQCQSSLAGRRLCKVFSPDDPDCVVQTCRHARCGDGRINKQLNNTGRPFEDCDDANDNPNDGCDQCQFSKWDNVVLIGAGQSRGNSLKWDLSEIPVALSVAGNGDLLIAAPVENTVFRMHLPADVDVGSDAFCSEYAPLEVAEGAEGAEGAEPKELHATLSLITGKEPGDSGDEGKAVNARFFSPISIDEDGTGNMVVVDRQQKKLRYIDREGIVHPLMGVDRAPTLEELTAGPEGVPALSTAARDPLQASFDGNGDVYFTEEDSPAGIRKISIETGLVQTIAGTNNNDAGLIDDFLSQNNTINPIHKQVLRATSVKSISNDVLIFETVTGRVDDNDIEGFDTSFKDGSSPYENENFGFRRIYVVLYPGTAQAVLFPLGISKDLQIDENAIKYEANSGYNENQGPLLENSRNVLFLYPGPLNADSDGNIFISECMFNRIWKINVDSNIEDLEERYRNVRPEIIMGGQKDIYKSCTTSTLEDVYNNVDGGIAANEDAGPTNLHPLERPYSFTVDARRDRIYIYEQSGRIYFARKDGSCKTPILGRGLNDNTIRSKLALLSSVRSPGGVTFPPLETRKEVIADKFSDMLMAFVLPKINKIYAVSQTGYHRELGSGKLRNATQETGDAGVQLDAGPTEKLKTNRPRAIATNHRGDLFVADQGSHRILKYTRDIGNKKDGALNYSQVEVLAGTGIEGDNTEGNNPLEWEFSSPSGISFDFAECTNDNNCVDTQMSTCNTTLKRCKNNNDFTPVKGDALLIADQGNHRIQRLELYPKTGSIRSETVIGTGEAGLTLSLYELGTNVAIDSPIGVEVVDVKNLLSPTDAVNAPFKKLILVVDRNNHSLLVFVNFYAFGIRLVARVGTPGIEGGVDGALNAATFSYPRGVGFDPYSANIIITDGVNRLRELRIDGFPSGLGDSLVGTVKTLRNSTLAPDDGTTRAFNDSPTHPVSTDLSLLNRPKQMAALPASDEMHFVIADGPEGRLRLWENNPLGCLRPELNTAIGFPEGPAANLEVTEKGQIARLSPFFGDASGVAAFGNGDLVISDATAQKIYYVSTFGALRGPKLDGCIQRSCPAGESFIAEGENGRCEPWRIRELTFAEQGVQSPGQLASISHIDGSAAALFVLDQTEHILLSYTFNDDATQLAGRKIIMGAQMQRGARFTENSPLDTELYAPQGLLLEPFNSNQKTPMTFTDVKGIFIADTQNHRIIHMQPQEAPFLFSMNTTGGPELIVSNAHLSIIIGIDSNADPSSSTPACDQPIAYPMGLSLDPLGNLFISGRGVVGAIAPQPESSPELTYNCEGSSSYAQGNYTHIFPVDPLVYPGSATQCLSSIYAKSENEVYALDACQGLGIYLHP